MPTEPNREETLFAAAMSLPSHERAPFLEQACAGDALLSQRVEALLRADEQADQFLEQLPGGVSAETVRVTPWMAQLTEQAGERIGRYKLLEKIGEGGFGEVWMAEQEEPVRRRVALKIIKLGMDTREVVARFEAERQALALMDHPHIAKVFDGGATGTGRPYFVMELVRGVPITEFCEQHKLSISERLELFMQVCAAVQHAHQKGIIHRDLKPSNVLVSVQDDRPVPKVIDFGIAKAVAQRLTEKTLFTRFHQFIGTPAYMSPEQTGANREDIDTRSDIYSLGVLLYELLTGRTPFDAHKLLEAGFEAILKTIREEEPPKPSTRLTTLTKKELNEIAIRRKITPETLGRLVRGELDWIVMRALEKERTRRYESATALARDVARHLGCEPVEAGPPSATYRLRRFIRRNRLSLGAASLVAIALVTATIVSVLSARSAGKARRIADDQRDQADLARRAEENESYSARIALASARVESGAPEQARPLIEGAATRLRDWEWNWLQRHLEAAPKRLGEFSGPIIAAFSADGQYAMTGAGLEVDAVIRADGSPDGKYSRTEAGAYVGKIIVWRLDRREGWTVPKEISGAKPLRAVGFTTDSQRAFTATSEDLSFWTLATSNRVMRFRPPAGYLHAVSPNGDRLATCISTSHHHVFSFWDTGSGLQPPRLLSTITNPLPARPYAILPSKPSPAPPLSSGPYIPEPRVLLSRNLRRMLTEETRFDQMKLKALQDNNQTDLTSAVVLRRSVWDTDTGRMLVAWPESPLAVMSREGETPGSSVRWYGKDGTAHFSADGRRLLVRWPSDRWPEKDDQARVYDTDTGRQIATWYCGRDSRDSPVAAFSPDGDCIAMSRQFRDRADIEHTAIEIWDARTGILRSAFEAELNSCADLTFALDGIHLVGLFSATSNIRLWNSATGRALGPKASRRVMHFARLSLDGRHLLSGGEGYSAWLWDLQASQPLLLLAPSGEPSLSNLTGCVAFSPDGERVAAAFGSLLGSQILVWDLVSGQASAVVRTTNGVNKVQFSYDGARLLAEHEILQSANSIRRITMYELPGGRELKHFKTDYTAVTPGGHWILGVESNLLEWRDLRQESTQSVSLRAWRALVGELAWERVESRNFQLSWNPRFLVQASPRAFLDPGTLSPLATIPPQAGRRVWFFAGTRRILELIQPQYTGPNPTNTQGNVVLYDADSQRVVASWSFQADVESFTPLHSPHLCEWTSPDDRRCVMLDSPTSAYILDTITGKPVAQLTGHAAQITKAVIFPNGKRVLTVSADHTAKLWDDTGRELLSFPCLQADSVTVSPDGRRIATVTADGLLLRSASPGMGAGVFAAQRTEPAVEPKPQLCATRYYQRDADRMKDLAIPLREPLAPPQLLDLSARYNTSLRGSWAILQPGQTTSRRYSLSALPLGRRIFAGTEFDARGALSTSSGRISASDSFSGYNQLYVGRFCDRIHFLHAAIGGDEDGAHVAHYFIRDMAGATNTVHVVYGEDLRDSLYDAKPLRDPQRATVAWEGNDDHGQPLRLFKSTWINPKPQIEIEAIDFVSANTGATPLLLAITVEDAEAPALPPSWTDGRTEEK